MIRRSIDPGILKAIEFKEALYISVDSLAESFDRMADDMERDPVGISKQTVLVFRDMATCLRETKEEQRTSELQ
jgi:hypothetical protein